MKTASTILVIASGLAVLAAVWAPGAWWQWVITAVVLLLAGAGTGSSAAKSEPFAKGGVIPPGSFPVHVRDGEVLSGTGDEELDRALNTRPTYGRKADR